MVSLKFTKVSINKLRMDIIRQPCCITESVHGVQTLIFYQSWPNPFWCAHITWQFAEGSVSYYCLHQQTSKPYHKLFICNILVCMC